MPWCVGSALALYSQLCRVGVGECRHALAELSCCADPYDASAGVASVPRTCDEWHQVPAFLIILFYFILFIYFYLFIYLFLFIYYLFILFIYLFIYLFILFILFFFLSHLARPDETPNECQPQFWRSAGVYSINFIPGLQHDDHGITYDEFLPKLS